MPILLNWLWQGSALTLVVALGVCRLHAVNAATRERIWWATLGAVCLMPAVSLLGLEPAVGLAGNSQAALVVVSAPSTEVVSAIGMIWTSWVAVSLLRLGGALLAIGRAKRTALPFPAARLATLSTWAPVSSQGRLATLAVSDRVKTAAVLGFGRPMIAVSPEVLDRLNDDELEDILVHEHGHVQRLDDFGVLLQRVMCAIFGLHPAVWWLNRALTLEREVACDDLVLAQERTSPQRYARSLVKLVEHATPDAGLRLAPGAFLSRPQLTRRIARLLDRRRNASATPSRSTIGFAAAVIGFAVVVMLSVELVALAAPTLASRRVGGALVGPYGASAASSSGPEAGDRSLARAMEAPVNTAGQAGQPQPGAGGARPEPAPLLPRGPDAVAPGSPEPPTTQSPSPEPLVVVTVVPPASQSSAPASPDGTATQGSTATRAHAPPGSPTPWGQAADAATAIGQGSRAGALKTAGFFTRIGKSVAGAF